MSVTGRRNTSRTDSGRRRIIERPGITAATATAGRGTVRRRERSGTAMTTSHQPWQAAAAADTGAAEPASRSTATRGTFSLDRCLFFGRVVDTLGRGSAFRTYIALSLKIAAAGIAFTGLIALFNAWQFTSRQEASGIIGGLAYMFFLVAGVYMVVHATILRAGVIASLPEEEFPLVSLCAVLSLLAGEAIAAFTASISLGGGILIWFAQRGASHLLRDVSAFVPPGEGADFLSGILFMIRGLVRAVAVLTGGYLVSELLQVVGKVARRGVRPSGE